jgi:transposase-like protein
MAKTADLVVHIADPAGVTAEIFRTNDEADLSNLLNEALLHFMRDPGWFEVNTPEGRYYACQLVTYPFLSVLSKYAYSSQVRILAERVRKIIYPYYSDTVVPDAWILVNRDLVTPLRRPTVNLWLARKLTNSLKKSVFIEPDAEAENKYDALPVITAPPPPAVKDAPPSKPKKRKGGPDPDKVMARVTLGWRVRDICEEQKCSEGYVYNLIKSRKGTSAMELRWKHWELISAMYHAEPKITVEEIEKTFSITRAAVYYAVRKIAERDGKALSPREREKKLTPGDAQNIKKKLEDGALRKDILAEYGITAETLIKHIGTREDYRPVPEELKEQVIRLRVQGKTLQQTADILCVTVSTVKDAWKEKKHSPDIQEKRVKYDNRNPLSKRDRDQAVKAVLIDGHTRKQIYTQYGINALTLRRYIREAQKRELNALREKDDDTEDSDDN